MFVRLVYESFRRQKRRKLLAGAAIVLGVTVATAMIAVATDIGDKINRELRTIEHVEVVFETAPAHLQGCAKGLRGELNLTLALRHDRCR